MSIQTKHTTLKEAWELYNAKTLYDAPPSIVRLLKLAFYTGAATVFDTLMLISQDEVSEDSGINILEATRKEFAEFSSEERKSKES